MERETGIEPALVAWKATVLPLNYSRPGILQTVQIKQKQKISWWREVDYSGRPALRPSGASLRLFKIAPGELVEPTCQFGGSHPPPTNADLLNELWWREVDSNHRRHEPADLQSAPVGRLGIPPNSSV